MPPASQAGPDGHPPSLDACHAVSRRAEQTLQWLSRQYSLLDTALDHLTLGRAALCAAILQATPPTACQPAIQLAVDGLRRACTLDHLPRALLTRAWLRSRTGPDSAQADLDEAWEIAERGPMPLFTAEIHLHRARLFWNATSYPWQSPAADLKAARHLIEKHGYQRRMEELQDAEAVLLPQSASR